MARLVRTVPPLPQTERGAFCHVGADKPGERILYCNGNSVIWRSLKSLLEAAESPDDLFCWKGHIRRATCAQMSPNSQWVVSGDVGGAIRVWGAKGEHVQKNEYKLWDGAVKDVSWSDDSTRIVAAGDGKEMRATAIIWDTGSKTGEVAGHTKQVNSISFRSQRPFRVMTGSEDMLVAFHQGPPFKFAKSHSEHGNFVNCVRFSPDGEWAISAGSDSKLCLYAGKEGDFIKEFEKPAGITGSLWAAAWSPDSTMIATAGGDKKLRVWGREAMAQLSESVVGAGTLDDMQVGISWVSQGRIMSCCLDGRLLVWDVEAGAGNLTLALTVQGTQGPLTSLSCDQKTGCFVQGSTDGSVAITAPGGKMPVRMKVGKGVQHVVTHSASFAGSGPPEAWVIALDNCVRRVALESGEPLGSAVEVKELMIGGGWLDPAETKLLVATSKRSLHSISAEGVAWTSAGALQRAPTALATLPGAPGRAAVALEKPDTTSGGVQSSQFDVLLFSITDAGAAAEGLSQQAVLTGHLGEVCALRFSPSGEYLASCNASSKVLVWKLEGAGGSLAFEWAGHTARVTSVDWMPDGHRIVTGSLDGRIYLWDTEGKAVKLEEVHKGGVTAVAANAGGGFASVGHDGFLQIHELS